MTTATTTAPTTFRTLNRKLEQVLFNHGIMFTAQAKDPDGMTIWIYNRTAELDSIVNQFRRSQQARVLQANRPASYNGQ